METGIYSDGPDRLDATYLFPYPGAGRKDYLVRLREVHEREGLSLIVPTLDSEFDNLIGLRDELDKMGILLIAPTATSFAARSKIRLSELCVKAKLVAPRTFRATDVTTAAQRALAIGYPCYVKGLHYEAHLVQTEAQLFAAFGRVVSTWGAPVLVQEAIYGEEYDVAAVAEHGELVAAITVRKLLRWKMGKALGGPLSCSRSTRAFRPGYPLP